MDRWVRDPPGTRHNTRAQDALLPHGAGSDYRTAAVIGVGSIIAGLDGAVTGLFRSWGPKTIVVMKTMAMGTHTRGAERRPLSWRTPARLPRGALRWNT